MDSIVGKKYGRLKVVSFSHTEIKTLSTSGRKYYNHFYECECECGNKCLVLKQCLISGHTQSCGCLQKDLAAKCQTTHGKCGGKLYNTWLNMKARCSNEKLPEYKNYGGKGIKVCKEWQNDYENFYNWAMSNGYKEELSIDRIDNSKGYNPENCRWATREEQANNMTTNIKIEYQGEIHTMKQWSKMLGISYSALRYRKNKLNLTPLQALIDLAEA